MSILHEPTDCKIILSKFHKALAVESVYYSLLVVRCLPKCILQIKDQVNEGES